jgi:hypothetical protein
MIFISAQPAETYFAWQLAVQLNNFKEVGIDLNKCHVLLAKKGEIPDSIFSLIGQYEPLGVKFFIKADKTNRKYLPSVRFWLLNFYQQYRPEVFEEEIFYHDSDIIFREKPDFCDLTTDDTWYCADARSYLDVSYITSKGKGLLENMCGIVKIDPVKVKFNNLNAGGVQYLLKKIPEGFFHKCEYDSEKMYRFLNKSIDLYKYLHELNNKTPYYPIQHWCTDMWVLWWNALLAKRNFKISELLSFTWATDVIENWNNTVIFHNAGVTAETKHLFNKTDYKHDIPIGKEITTSDHHCSWYYVEAIKRTPCL